MTDDATKTAVEITKLIGKVDTLSLTTRTNFDDARNLHLRTEVERQSDNRHCHLDVWNFPGTHDGFAVKRNTLT